MQEVFDIDVSYECIQAYHPEAREIVEGDGGLLNYAAITRLVSGGGREVFDEVLGCSMDVNSVCHIQFCLFPRPSPGLFLFFRIFTCGSFASIH